MKFTRKLQVGVGLLLAVLMYALGLMALQYNIANAQEVPSSTSDSSSDTGSNGDTTSPENGGSENTSSDASSGDTTPAYFSIVKKEAFCAMGKTVWYLDFLVTPKPGGYFLLPGSFYDGEKLYTDSSLTLQSGTYVWEATALPGYHVYGSNEGKLVLEDMCASTGGSDAGKSINLTSTDSVGDFTVIITLKGASDIYKEYGEYFSDPGAVVVLKKGEDLVKRVTVYADKDVDTTKPGVYTLEYRFVSEKGDIKAQTVRKVHVLKKEEADVPLDTTEPVFKPVNVSPATSNTTIDPDGNTTNTSPTKPLPVEYKIADESDVELSLYKNGELITDHIVRGRVYAEILVEGAEKVVLYLTDRKTGEKSRIGTAQPLSSKQSYWGIDLDSSKVRDGSYRVFAVARIDGAEVIGRGILVYVRNQNYITPVKPSVDANGDGRINEADEAVAQLTTEMKEDILNRVRDSRACQNSVECQVVCENFDDCHDFVKEKVAQTNIRAITEMIDAEQVKVVLENNEGPGGCSSLRECQEFCSSSTNDAACFGFITEHHLMDAQEMQEKRNELIQIRDKRITMMKERIGARAFQDSDADGITDYDEINMYDTDPNNPDSDGDGKNDGDELLSGTNPRSGGRVSMTTSEGPLAATDVIPDMLGVKAEEERIVYEDPKNAGEVQEDIFEVEEVAVAEVETAEDGTTQASKLAIRGRGLPNSFVTLYIFSDPIVATVRTDGDGVFVYELDKELEDGTHEAYVAIADNSGKILAKSNPLPFIKEAAAVEVGSPALLPAVENREPGFFRGNSLFAMVAVIVGVVGIALSLLGFLSRRRHYAVQHDDME